MRPTQQAIEQWLATEVARHLKIDAAKVELEKPLLTTLDSLNGVAIIAGLEDWLELDIPITVVWDYPTIRTLSRALADGSVGQAMQDL